MRMITSENLKYLNMGNPTVFDCGLIYLPKIGNRNGSITAINGEVELPYEIERVFYLYDIPGGESRGAHAHKDCHQFLIAVSGSFEVVLDDSKTKRQILLNQPNIALHIVPGIWNKMEGNIWSIVPHFRMHRGND